VKKPILLALVLCALFTCAACIDITPYPIVETDAGAEEPSPPGEGDAGADGE